MTAKTGNDKSEEKIPPSQPKGLGHSNINQKAAEIPDGPCQDCVQSIYTSSFRWREVVCRSSYNVGVLQNLREPKDGFRIPFVYEHVEYRWYRLSGHPQKKKELEAASSGSSSKCTSRDNGTQGSKKSLQKQGTPRSVLHTSSYRNMKQKTEKAGLDKADILKLVLSLLD
ncbi:hypothetical protein RCL_jg23294.t1 [Rhizophagus clarus]|uniref:Uncharacterized protein n=1 Tax=Rhizophagus clarus TaxID=94130 RepID=A0A8H3L2S0_9GLOM|nr:hypothetical protein RCL_jg23294.t1 [Rhizophagus clarus]